MSTQWHPLFARLLGLLLEEFYEIQTEQAVSDLPRKADILLIRRQPGPPPPFQGLWRHLTDWNVFEFKGPSDGAEEDDLELLVHVGTGITCRLNEERRLRQEERLGNDQVSFWYLVRELGETFLGHARSRTFFDYQTEGLWRGKVWGHAVWLVAYRDVPVEVDTIPLHLLDRDPAAPRSLGEIVLGREELLRRFAAWVSALQPDLWKEIQQMASKLPGGPVIDWQSLGTLADLREAVRILPPEEVIQTLGVARAIEVIGLKQVIDTVGLRRVIEASGPEQILDALQAQLPPDQFQEMLRRRQQP
jgi:hypothetical protein